MSAPPEICIDLAAQDLLTPASPEPVAKIDDARVQTPGTAQNGLEIELTPEQIDELLAAVFPE